MGAVWLPKMPMLEGQGWVVRKESPFWLCWEWLVREERDYIAMECKVQIRTHRAGEWTWHSNEKRHEHMNKEMKEQKVCQPTQTASLNIFPLMFVIRSFKLSKSDFPCSKTAFITKKECWRTRLSGSLVWQSAGGEKSRQHVELCSWKLHSVLPWLLVVYHFKSRVHLAARLAISTFPWTA